MLISEMLDVTDDYLRVTDNKEVTTLLITHYIKTFECFCNEMLFDAA